MVASMSNEDENTAGTRIRGRTVDVPAWWLRRLVAAVADYRDAGGRRLSQARLAEALAEAVGRDEPWSQSLISYALQGEKLNEELVAAFCAVLSLPSPFFTAESEAEAVAFEAVRRAIREPRQSEPHVVSEPQESNPCPQCGNEWVIELGDLGGMKQFRCRGCGWTFGAERT